MEALLNSKHINAQRDCVTLYSLVRRLVAAVLPTSVRNKTFIINEIPLDLAVMANCENVTAVLSDLFNTIAIHTINSCIRISAKAYGHVILVQVKDENSMNTYTIANSLQAAQPLAEKIGGYLGVTSQRKNETTIVFSFPNIPAAA